MLTNRPHVIAELGLERLADAAKKAVDVVRRVERRHQRVHILQLGLCSQHYASPRNPIRTLPPLVVIHVQNDVESSLRVFLVYAAEGDPNALVVYA